MKNKEVVGFIQSWLGDYCDNARMDGFIIGVSGGIDSAVTSTLCALTGKKVVCLNMPIHQSEHELDRAQEHISWLISNHPNVETIDVELTSTFDVLKSVMPENVQKNDLALANSRSRLRMLALYAVGQDLKLLVTGTGNKVEDFGIGFYTKYGDGGVDISPIADLMKSEVYALGRELGIINSILTAPPTDGLWFDGRTDEDAIGATYPELEWAMTYEGTTDSLSERQKEVLEIYNKFNRANKHKMTPIPVCLIPENLR